TSLRYAPEAAVTGSAGPRAMLLDELAASSAVGVNQRGAHFHPTAVLEELWAILLSECEELGAVDWRWQAADRCMGQARFGGGERAPTLLIEPKRARRRA